MGVSHRFTCDRCGAQTEKPGGWRLVVVQMVDGDVRSVGDDQEHILCTSCGDLVSLALHADPFAGLPETADPEPVRIYLPAGRAIPAVMNAIGDILSAHPGRQDVILRLWANGKRTTTVATNQRVTANAAFTGAMKQLLGPGCFTPR